MSEHQKDRNHEAYVVGVKRMLVAREEFLANAKELWARIMAKKTMSEEKSSEGTVLNNLALTRAMDEHIANEIKQDKINKGKSLVGGKAKRFSGRLSKGRI